jgi:DNA repair photolyase
VGFDASINPYRGCEHGCPYCYARPTHEYVGLSAGLDFESTILVKEHAPELLRDELSKPSWVPRVIGVSGVTDAYQPIERRLELTRRCLEVLAEARNPVVVVTKNRLVTRDADVLARLAAVRAAAVFVTITTLDPALARTMEPRASSPQKRLGAIRLLADEGIPVGVMIAPTIPGLTDHEMPQIMDAVAQHGGRYAGYALLRLPYGVKDIFETWLADHLPLKKERVLNRIREVRDGRLTDTEWHRRMRGQGVYAEHIRQVFEVSKRRHGFLGRGPELSVDSFCRPAPAGQLRLC